MLVRQHLADAVLLRVSRALNWPRVRLLFIGHREAVGAGVEPDVDAVSAPNGCPFSRLDHDLLWCVADWLGRNDLAEHSLGS